MSASYKSLDEESDTGSDTRNSNTKLETDSESVVSNIQTSNDVMKRRYNGLGNTDQVSNVTTSQQMLQDSTDGWESSAADHIKSFECPAGNRYTSKQTTVERWQTSVGWVIDHFIFRAVTIFLIIVDLSIVITTLCLPPEENVDALLVLDYVALIFSCYFILEVSARIFAKTPKVFFRDVLEIIDAFAVLVSFIVVVIDLPLESSGSRYAKVVTGVRLVRLVRFVMLIRITITQRKQLARASRLMVSENKRRYQKDGFDLDLCYITDRMIAMSFPSQGIMSIYRNPIEEVSKFFTTKYFEHYRIYNCCSERGYDADKYFDGCVTRIKIDDHNVPSLKQMLDFVDEVQKWLDADRLNVIAIHCKGGKGRTGTMVCVWLLHSDAFASADDALDYFAHRRTDLSVSDKFQGVETPSQSRYVKYFERMKLEHGGKLPPEKRLKPTKIAVSGLKGIGTGDGKDLIVKLISLGNLIFEAKFETNTNCITLFDRETYTITATLNNAPILCGDVKVRFEATSDIPCDYDDCPWYFWFNTSFVENNEISLDREELDNPHKTKTWKLYKQDFKVTLSFTDV